MICHHHHAPHLHPSTATPSAAAGTQWDARLWGILILLCGVLFLDGLDVSMIDVALPSIRSDLGCPHRSCRGSSPATWNYRIVTGTSASTVDTEAFEMDDEQAPGGSRSEAAPLPHP